MLKYRVRRYRVDGFDYSDQIGPVPRQGDLIYLGDDILKVNEVLWTPSSVDDVVAEVTVGI